MIDTFEIINAAINCLRGEHNRNQNIYREREREHYVIVQTIGVQAASTNRTHTKYRHLMPKTLTHTDLADIGQT